jgi:hypothetical protein
MENIEQEAKCAPAGMVENSMDENPNIMLVLISLNPPRQHRSCLAPLPVIPYSVISVSCHFSD